MKRFTFIYILLPLLVAASCTENKMLSYENDPAVYFAGGISGDSLNHSFFLLNTNILRDTVLVKVNTMGELAAEDRPVSIVQTNAGTENAAIAGVHYVPFDDPDVKNLAVVPAGKEFVEIPVILLRDKSLDTTQVRLELTVLANEHFRRGINTKLRFLVTTTNLIEKPAAWDTRWYMFLGRSWGPVKMRFLIDVTGYTDWYTTPTDMSLLQYLGNLARQKLIEYNRDHPDDPLREANGDLVVI
jgi:hypothetical protein